MIGYSFVQKASDVERLQAELRARRPDDWRQLGVLAKIETPKAVRNLPELIVTAGASILDTSCSTTSITAEGGSALRTR